MRTIIGFFIKRLRREGLKGVSVPVLALALVFLINTMWGIKARMAAEYQDALDNFVITFEVSDSDGASTDGLQITDSILERFTDPDALWSLYSFTDEIKLKTSLDIVSEYSAQPENVVLWGISGAGVIPHIAAEHEFGTGDIEVTLYSRYEGIPFRELEGCIISEELLDYVEHDLLSVTTIVQKGPNRLTYDIHIPVLGTVSGLAGGHVFYSDYAYQLYCLRVYTKVPDSTFYVDIDGFNEYLDEHRDEMPEMNSPDYTKLLESYMYRYFPPHEVALLASMADKTAVIGPLVGISTPLVIDGFRSGGSGSITYVEGYDESIFDIQEGSADMRVAVVSEGLFDMINEGIINISVRSRSGGIVHKPVHVELKVIGTASDAGDKVVYIPFQLARELGMESAGTLPATERIRGKIASNIELDAFKEEANRSFLNKGTFFNPQQFALTIFDAEYYDTTEVLQQTLFFLSIVMPFLFSISIGIGFITSFQMTRRRRYEFANMRSVGIGKEKIFLGFMFEQAFLCATGVVF